MFTQLIIVQRGENSFGSWNNFYLKKKINVKAAQKMIDENIVKLKTCCFVRYRIELVLRVKWGLKMLWNFKNENEKKNERRL